IRCERVDAHRGREAAMSITREEIRQLCIAHDRLMAEHASEPIRRPPMSETDDAGLVYKEFDNGALAPAPQADADWSGWERWLRAHLNIERGGLLDALKKDLVNIIAEKRRVTRQESEAEILKLKSEIAELRGRLDMMVNLMTKTGDVIDLPRGGWRRDR